MYTSEILHSMKGQAIKDIWHGMIGKPPGLKNTTGLKNTEEIIQAILKAQETSPVVSQVTLQTPKVVEPSRVEASMGPKKQVPKKTSTLALESTELPLSGVEVQRVTLRKLHLEHISYFLDPETNNLYTIQDNRPGSLCGSWNPETRKVSSETR